MDGKVQNPSARRNRDAEERPVNSHKDRKAQQGERPAIAKEILHRYELTVAQLLLAANRIQEMTEPQ